jgi:hypothetical protein
MSLAKRFARDEAMRRSTLLANVLLPVVVAVAGCASMDRIDWNGAPITRAMAKLGQPTAIRAAGDGAATYEFDQKREVLCATAPTDSAPGQPQGKIGGVCGVERRRWTFVVDRGGVIVRWSVGEWRRWERREAASTPPS